MTYTSRYSNPELRTKKYTAVRISLGTPKWDVGYDLNGELADLMPFGLLNKFEEYKDFEKAYFSRLDAKGVKRILNQLYHFENYGKDVVLLCYEDIRKEDEWCHRRTFADWWMKNTGEEIPELQDPTMPKLTKERQVNVTESRNSRLILPQFEQMSLF